MKRRRVTNSSSPKPEAQVTVWNPTPRRSREPPSPFYSSQPALQRTNSDVTSRPSQRSVAVVGKSTPFAYATPYSGAFLGGPAFSRYNNGGDTEPDDDDDDDGEASWHGVTDGDGDSASSSSSDAIAGADEPGSFSGDDSTPSSESGQDARSGDEAGFGAQLQHFDEEDDDDDDDEEEEEEEEDIFNSMLHILGK